MKSIYQAQYVCKWIDPVGLPGYDNVTLGLQGGNGNSDILIKGTCSRFVVGQEYLVNILEM